MRFLIILVTFFLSFFIFPTPIHAHLAGQPPYFRIDGKFSNFYPVLTNANFPEGPLPQDIAPDNYIVNEPINLEIDKSQLELIIPKEIVEKTKFIWDFGDGTKGEGIKNTHSYKKMGSYVISINADTTSFEKNVTPQIIQSVMLNILPNKDYKLPQAVIAINGKTEVNDPVNHMFQVNLRQDILFDASFSKPGSSKTISFYWDFDDEESGSGVSFSHQYKNSREIASPSLRVKDENGFISDTFVGLRNNPKISNQPQQSVHKSSESYIKYIAIAVAITILVVIATVFAKKVR